LDTAVIAVCGGVRKARGGPQRERAPAAAEIEDALAVGKLRALRIQLEHRGFCSCECVDAARPITRRVFELRAEHALEERGRDFVVLRVRGVDRDRDVARAQLRDEALLIGAALLAQAQRTDRSDAGAQQRLGNEA
jgi:hypothetical protein